MVTATGKRDKISFRMSSAGKCPRALSAQLLGMEGEVVPEFVLRAAEEGNWHEERIIDKLGEEEDYRIFSRQLEVKLEYPSFILIGHIDGIAGVSPYDNEEPNKDYLLEIKTMSQYEFDRWMKGGFKAFPNYADQITCYMEATGLNECLYIVKNRSSGYEDRRVLTEKPSYMTEIIGKFTDVTNHIIGSELVPREPDLNSIECRRCEYKKLCLPEPKELTPVEQNRLEVAVASYRSGKRLVTDGQALIDEAKKLLEQHTRATNILKWSFNKLAIQLVKVKEGKVSYTREASEYLRITDLEKNNGSVV